MSEIKAVNQDKYQYFQHIAGKRLERTLEDLDSLGSCSSPAVYAYHNEDLPPIFTAIMLKLGEIRQRLATHSPHNGIPFRLRPPDTVEIDGHVIDRRELASMGEVMALLDEGIPNFTSLEPVRKQYENRFGSELCWTCPASHAGHSGCILLLVQEGVLYLPYTEVSGGTYEQFDLRSMELLTKEQAQVLLSRLWEVYSQLFCLLSDIQAFGLAQSEPTGELEHKSLYSNLKHI